MAGRQALQRIHVPAARSEAVRLMRQLLPLCESSSSTDHQALVDVSEQTYLAVGQLVALLRRSSM